MHELYLRILRLLADRRQYQTKEFRLQYLCQVQVMSWLLLFGLSWLLYFLGYFLIRLLSANLLSHYANKAKRLSNSLVVIGS